MSDQGPVNSPFNDQLETVRSELLPHVVDNWGNLDEESRNKFKEMGNFYCKMHLLVNMAEEASKALELFERAATEGQSNSFDFSSANESAAFRLKRTSCEAFHPRGSQNAGAASDYNAYLSEVGGGRNRMQHSLYATDLTYYSLKQQQFSIIKSTFKDFYQNYFLYIVFNSL